jgi:hypothetical protein
MCDKNDPTLTGIPAELKLDLCSLLDKTTLLALRAVSNRWLNFTTPTLAEKIKDKLVCIDVLITRDGLDTFRSLTRTPRFMNLIVEINFIGGVAGFLEESKASTTIQYSEDQMIAVTQLIEEQKEFELEMKEALQILTYAMRNMRWAMKISTINVGSVLSGPEVDHACGLPSILDALRLTQEQQGQLSHLCSVSKSRNMLNEVIIPFCAFKASQFSKPVINFHINPDNIQLNEMANLPESFVGTNQVLLSKFFISSTVGPNTLMHTEGYHNQSEQLRRCMDLAKNTAELTLFGCMGRNECSVCDPDSQDDDPYFGTRCVDQGCFACCDMAQALSDSKFGHINHLKLNALALSAETITDLIRSNRDTLQTIDLIDMELTSGTWKAVFEALRNVPHLYELMLGDLYQPIGTHNTEYSEFHHQTFDNLFGLEDSDNVANYLELCVNSFEAALAFATGDKSGGHVKVVLPSPIYAKTLTADSWDKNLEPTIHAIPQQIQNNGGMEDVEEGVECLEVSGPVEETHE